MRVVAQFIALVLAIGLATPVAAEPETRVDLAYEIYLGGFHVGTLRLRAEIAEQRYHLVADTRSRGVIDLLIGFTSKAETVGRLVDGRVSPNWHAADNTWLGQPRRVRNDWPTTPGWASRGGCATTTGRTGVSAIARCPRQETTTGTRYRRTGWSGRWTR